MLLGGVGTIPEYTAKATQHMTPYKHTQIGYLILAVMLVVLVFFLWVNSVARAEPPSVDSGTNLLVTSAMVFIVLLLASFTTLTVSIQGEYLKVRFGYGIFRTRFALRDIVSVERVRNRWYYGWGIRLWLWPRTWIYTVSGFDAVELQLRDGSRYRIGTDVPDELCAAVSRALQR